MNEQEPGVGGGGKFDPTRHLRQLRGRGGSSDYLDVKWRLVWLRSEHPDAQITTEHVTITSDMAIFKARVTIPEGGSATGYGSESSGDFTDFIEKAETKALGRALIALGYGTQFAQEFGEAHLAVQIEAIVGCVLGDENKFTHAVANQFLGLADNLLDRLRDVLAAHTRDGAEGAKPIAALADLEIRIMPWRDA